MTQRGRYSKHRCRRLAGIACAVLAGLLFASAVPAFSFAGADNSERRVLFISSYSLSFATVPDQIDGINSVLAEDATLDYLFMDSKLLRDDVSQQLFYESCQNKLAQSRAYDLVILGDDAALQFALDYRSTLFAGIPLVFEGVNDVARAELAGRDPLITGVVELPPLSENLNMALSLYPNATRIVGIVDDTETGVGDAAQFMAQQSSFPQLHFSLLDSSRLSRAALCETLRYMNDDTILFSFSMNDNAAGVAYSQREQMEIIRDYAQVPVFRMATLGMGDGFFGGKMVSHTELGRIAGEMAKQILAGTDPADIPVQMDSPASYRYDLTVMERYGIDKSDIPVGASFYNTPVNFWSENRQVVLPATLLIAVLLCITIYIVVDNYRYRKTTKALQAATARLAYTAHYDTLTGVYRRSYFFERAAALMAENPGKHYVIFRTDIYHFRVVNDLYSSETGDRVLREFARHLREYIGDNGVCARFQADNFVGFVPYDGFDANAFMNYLDEGLRTTLPGHELTVNLGLYETADETLAVVLMCDRASLALRSVKGNFINRYAWYDGSLRKTLLAEQSIVGCMQDALKNHEFQLYLQPIVDLATEKPVSAEALVRWKHPQFGMISPGEFIPVFERNGFITKLDTFMCEEVCRFLHSAIEKDLDPFSISINLSRADFGSETLFDSIIALTKHYNVPRGLLKLEVTESAYTDSPLHMLEATGRLRQEGFQILMDDFGSGYSSLNMLKDMPVDILKLDICFLQQFQKSGRTAAIMSSVVQMAKSLDMYVVAEGVETAEQAEFLRGIGCDAAQGYYFSKPLPVEEFRALVRTSRGIA